MLNTLQVRTHAYTGYWLLNDTLGFQAVDQNSGSLRASTGLVADNLLNPEIVVQGYFDIIRSENKTET